MCWRGEQLTGAPLFLRIRLELPAGNDLELELPPLRNLVVPGRNGLLADVQRLGNRALASEVLDNVLLPHLCTKPQFSTGRNRLLAETVDDRYMTQGARIKEAADSWIRENQARTAKELCDKIGVTEQAFYKWIDGNTKSIKAENFMKFVSLTRFHPRYLLWGEKPKMLMDDSKSTALLYQVSDMEGAEFAKLVDYADTLIRARKPK